MADPALPPGQQAWTDAWRRAALATIDELLAGVDPAAVTPAEMGRIRATADGLRAGVLLDYQIARELFHFRDLAPLDAPTEAGTRRSG